MDCCCKRKYILGARGGAVVCVRKREREKEREEEEEERRIETNHSVLDQSKSTFLKSMRLKIDYSDRKSGQKKENQRPKKKLGGVVKKIYGKNDAEETMMMAMLAVRMMKREQKRKRQTTIDGVGHNQGSRSISNRRKPNYQLFLGVFD